MKNCPSCKHYLLDQASQCRHCGWVVPEPPSIVPPPSSWPDDPSVRDNKAKETVYRYACGAGVAMLAIPVPGADMAATFGVWAKMIRELAKVYDYEVSLEDAKRLASDLFKGVILTTMAWFGSAKVATTVMKFIPGAGQAAAYVVDAAIAGWGSKKITSGLGLAAAAYYKSGKTLAPQDLAGHVKNLFEGSELDFLTILEAIPGPQLGSP